MPEHVHASKKKLIGRETEEELCLKWEESFSLDCQWTKKSVPNRESSDFLATGTVISGSLQSFAKVVLYLCLVVITAVVAIVILLFRVIRKLLINNANATTRQDKKVCFKTIQMEISLFPSRKTEK